MEHIISISILLTITIVVNNSGSLSGFSSIFHSNPKVLVPLHFLGFSLSAFHSVDSVEPRLAHDIFHDATENEHGPAQERQPFVRGRYSQGLPSFHPLGF